MRQSRWGDDGRHHLPIPPGLLPLHKVKGRNDKEVKGKGKNDVLVIQLGGFRFTPPTLRLVIYFPLPSPVSGGLLRLLLRPTRLSESLVFDRQGIGNINRGVQRGIPYGGGLGVSPSYIYFPLSSRRVLQRKEGGEVLKPTGRADGQ